jgi:fucose permease
MQTKLSKEYRLFAVCSFCAFIVYAFYVNSFGTNAGIMMDFFQMTESRQGFIITIQSVGGIATAIWLSLFGERYNKIRIIAACLALLAVGSLLIGFIPVLLSGSGGYFLLLLFVIFAGVGFTGIDVMMNGVITETYPANKNTLLPTAHAFFSTGAMVAPMFVATLVDTSRPSSFAVPFLAIGIMSAVVFAAYSAVGSRIMPTTPYANLQEVRSRVSENPAEIFKSKKAWLLLLACVLYFSFQVGLSI